MAKKSKKEKQAEEVFEETIHIEEEDVAAKADQKDWSEEFVVAGNEIVDFVKKMAHEVGVRRIVLTNKKHDLHWEVPLAFGVMGMLVLPAALTMLSLVAALVTECSIVVERVEPVAEAEAEVAAA
jgi:hypothetical protein